MLKVEKNSNDMSLFMYACIYDFHNQNIKYELSAESLHQEQFKSLKLNSD